MDSPEPEPPPGYVARPDYRVGLHTRCPFKGQASYWRAPGHDRPWVAWSYPTPCPQVARIAGYVAFDQGTVSVAIGTGRFTGVRP